MKMSKPRQLECETSKLQGLGEDGVQVGQLPKLNRQGRREVVIDQVGRGSSEEPSQD